jgi:hypothetical protein
LVIKHVFVAFLGLLPVKLIVVVLLSLGFRGEQGLKPFELVWSVAFPDHLLVDLRDKLLLVL